MTFKYRLFKSLTGFNLFFSAYLILAGILSLVEGEIGAVLGYLFLVGAVLVHAILSLQLQRSLVDSNIVLKESTPGGIRIMGGICIFFGGLITLFCGIMLLCILFMKTADIASYMKQMTAGQRKQVTEAMGYLTPQIIVRIAGMFFIGLFILVNAVLSFSFLKQWRKREEGPNL